MGLWERLWSRDRIFFRDRIFLQGLFGILDGCVGAWLFVAAVLYCFGWSTIAIAQLFLGFIVLLFIAVPFIFKCFPYIQRVFVFLPFWRMAININFSDPTNEGLRGTKNFYLETDPGVTVGVWQILPDSQVEESDGISEESDWWDRQLNDGRTVVLYLHGISGHRALGHRKEIYQVLRSMDFHVITFDYRGFADSSKHIAPTETGVVKDARVVYDWLRSRAGGKVVVWGHSLGSAIASHLVADLCREIRGPYALILEAPFNNVVEEATFLVKRNPIGWLWWKLPIYHSFITEPLITNDLAFTTDKRLQAIHVPILILHAEDDNVVPFRLGRALYYSALEGRPSSWPTVHWIGFGHQHGYAHKLLCRAPELPDIIREFLAP